MRTKTSCLKRIYQALGGTQEVVPHEETVCDFLHKIGDCIGSFVDKVDNVINDVDDLADKVETMNNYTTEEVQIGKWINGKPIYRKVIQSTVENVQTDLNALGADRVINFFGEALSNYGNWFLIPCKNPASIDYENADHYTIAIIQSNTAARNFQITFGDYYNSENAVNIIIEYTKKEV